MWLNNIEQYIEHTVLHKLKASYCAWHLLILVGGDCDELRLDERVCTKTVVSHLEEVACTD